MKYLFILILLQFLILYNGVLKAQWVKTNCPNGGEVHCFTVSDSNIFAGTDNKGAFLSTDNGTNWSQVGPSNNPVYFLNFSGTNLFAGTYGGIFLSTNLGTNWIQLSNDSVSYWNLAFTTIGANIFVGTDKGVFLSTNNGLNWTLVNNGLTSPNVLSLDTIKNNIFAGTAPFNHSGGGVFLSTNNGTNWTQKGLTSSYVYCLTVSGTNIFAGTNAGIYLSTDNGTNWALKNNGLSSFPPLYTTSIVTSITNIFAGSFGSGVFLSTDYGSNWSQVNNGLMDTVICSLTINSNYIFAGTYRSGVWRRPLSELVGVSKEVNDLPKDFSLSQNYPNPFNPSTVISYSLLLASNVKLIVYNTLGQDVKVLENGFKNAGKYSVNYNASDLPSGIYFYKLEAGQFTQVKKMMLIK
jgi:photosystem II stability/assembly factor-like uncharacterized protein